jgi:hypothetical protein
MVQTINLNDFRNAFQEIRPNNFSYEGLERLYDYLSEMEPQYELDVIGLCCDFCEMPIDEVIEAYPDCLAKYDDEDPSEDKYSVVMEYLTYNTLVCGDTAQGTIVFGQF